MSPYIPGLHDLVAVLATWSVGAVLALAGAGLTGRRVAPEFHIAAGWGALCLLLTGWGVLLPFSLRIPAAAFIVAAFAAAARGRRPSTAAWSALGRVLVLSLPLWLVLAPIRPSQPDTFLNLLPNAFYLVDYGRLPDAASPPGFSLLPGAPYNSQFLSFLGALFAADYPAGGMSLVNVMLQLAAALAIARALAPRTAAPDSAPTWGMAAIGLLLATLLNPGFVPRIDLSAYDEPALAATTLLAAIGFVTVQGELAAGRRPRLLALALVLAALVNTKQSGIGLLAALAGAAAITASTERAIPRSAALRCIGVAAVPAICLYLVWRWYVFHAGIAELQPLPFAEWNWQTLPATVASAVAVVREKPVYFACVAIAFIGLADFRRRQRGGTPAGRMLTFHAALFVLYNAFLLLTYLGHFPREMSIGAHSFFRYNTHLSLVLVLSLAMAASEWGVGRLTGGYSRLAGAAAVAAILLAPIGFVGRLRFDLVMPQPLVWDLAKRLSGYVHNGDRLALLLPGDNGSVATMIAGVLADTTPRRTGLDLLRRNTADLATLDEAARLGYPLALISCTDDGGPPGLPPSQAVLLRHREDGWHAEAAWPYPAYDPKAHWQNILSWEPLCRHS